MSETDFVKKMMTKNDKRVYVGSILVTLIGYIGLTLWLNAVRTTSSLWFLWVLIIIQFVLYALIFSTSYTRAKALGLKYSSIWIFIILAVLGRINDWELAVIPLVIVVMLILSAKGPVKELDPNKA